MRLDLSGPPGKRLAVPGELFVHLGFSSSYWRNHRPRGPSLCSQCSASLEEGPCRESVATPFTLLMGSFSVSVVQMGGLRIFTMVSCLWIVASVDL